MSVHKNPVVAVIGAGYWGKNLVRNFAELGVLRTVCDATPETCRRLSAQFPDVTFTKELATVLNDQSVDAVAVATPAVLHYEIVKQALEAGKDVFVEKPLALSYIEGKELIDLADERNRILMVGHLLEYHPAIIKLKQMVEAGDLGRIRYIYSHRLNIGKFRTEENILWSFAPHDISVILSLMGQLPTDLSACGGEFLNSDISDVTVTTMNFSHSTKAHIFVSWLHPYKEQKLVVIGGRKMVVFDDVASENKLVVYDHHIQWRGNLPVADKRDGEPVPFTMEEPLKRECLHFIECLTNRQKPLTSGLSGLNVLRVLEASQKSLIGNGAKISLETSNYHVHPTSVIEQPASIGDNTSIWHYSHVMPDVNIGRSCNFGQNVFIGRHVKIGNNVKIQNNVSIYDGVTLEDDVFCGPSCVFTNVKTPRSYHPAGYENYGKTVVRKGATIGANATIVCGTTIGAYAFIGAGSVVTKDVPDYALVYGNPARIHGWMCECGNRLSEDTSGDIACSGCDAQYVLSRDKSQSVIRRKACTYHSLT